MLHGAPSPIPSTPITGVVNHQATTVSIGNAENPIDNISLNTVARMITDGPPDQLTTNICASSGLEPDPLNRMTTIEYESSVEDPNHSPRQPHADVKVDDERVEDPDGPMERCPLNCSSPICAFLEELLAPGLLLSPTFIFMLLSNILTMQGKSCLKIYHKLINFSNLTVLPTFLYVSIDSQD